MNLAADAAPFPGSEGFDPAPFVGTVWDLFYGFLIVGLLGAGLIVLAVSSVRVFRGRDVPPSTGTWFFGVASLLSGGFLVVTKAITSSLEEGRGIEPEGIQFWLAGAAIAALLLVVAILATLLYRSKRREAAARRGRG